ncbi:uncharacterized protein BJX67DRAFT_368923 [Aspergillus lucknowensis]|uniref:Uncharacterized protein n=1 Tax=Aspergillus lucknowensis TaxID=176173 RepID=A0ABR4L3I8_9EURO
MSRASGSCRGASSSGQSDTGIQSAQLDLAAKDIRASAAWRLSSGVKNQVQLDPGADGVVSDVNAVALARISAEWRFGRPFSTTEAVAGVVLASFRPSSRRPSPRKGKSPYCAPSKNQFGGADTGLGIMLGAGG